MKKMKVNATEGYEDYLVVFETPSSGVPYRIPAVGQTRNGDLIFVSDYRYSKTDIGVVNNGKLDLRFRKHYTDGTWGEIKTLAACIESPVFTAFGDPCIVCDRESDRVMVTSCCGNVSYWGGTHENHQGWSRWYSEDGGETWDSMYVDLAPQVVEQLDKRYNDSVNSFFIGSGKISQSKQIKVNKYYRLYCSSLTRMKSGTFNFVWYSDDFGETWNILGSPNETPVSGGDEPKAEELPDGSVILSSRTVGRIFNIYHYTDAAKAEGYWGIQKISSNNNNGCWGANCNGEIMFVPVINNSNRKKTYLALQSIPIGGSRVNVGIYYKELTDLNVYRTATLLAPNWERFQISITSSGYSTMCQMKDGRIAFFYEENEHNSGYNNTYVKYSIQTITGGAYGYCPFSETDKKEFLANGIDAYINKLDIVDDNVAQQVNTLVAEYKNDPNLVTYGKINALLYGS